MGAALSLSDRELIVKAKLAGKTLVEISSENGFSHSTTGNIWRRFKKYGFEGLGANYHHCGPKQIKSSALIYRCCLFLKRKYPLWGAPIIRTILTERYPYERLPTVRTIQLWFKKAGLNAAKFHRETPKAAQVKEAHDCWQLDAKENIKLLDGSKACYLTSVDVKSGAVLGTPVFPSGKN